MENMFGHLIIVTIFVLAFGQLNGLAVNETTPLPSTPTQSTTPFTQPSQHVVVLVSTSSVTVKKSSSSPIIVPSKSVAPPLPTSSSAVSPTPTPTVTTTTHDHTKEKKSYGRRFDTGSFIGGMIVMAAVIVIFFIVRKFWRGRPNYGKLL